MSTQNSNSSDWTTVGTSNQRNNRRVLNATQAQPTRRQPDNIPWVKGMKLGPGAPHGANFQRRIDESNQYSGAGTVNDPMVTWVVPQVDKKSDAEKAKLPAQTKVISDLTKDYGLSHAWIASEPHNTSTTKWVDGDRYIEDDDYHVTLRLGKSKDVCNLHGHAYLLFEDNDPAKQVKRTILNKERSIKGGSNPQLWVWGNYPPESKDWPRTQVQYPSSPFEVMQNSILSKQLNGTSRTGISKSGSSRHGTSRHGTSRHGTSRHGTSRQYLKQQTLSLTGLSMRTLPFNGRYRKAPNQRT